MTLRVMKAEREASLLEDPVWDESLMVQLPQDVFERLLRYLFDADIDRDRFNRRITSICRPELKTIAMTLADQLRQEGRQEGRYEGLASGLRESILEALEVRFEEIPEGLQEVIDAIHDSGRLRLLHKAAITAATIEDFSAAL